MVRKTAIGFTLCALLVAVAIMLMILTNGIPYGFMDFDVNGFVSPREAIRSLDMGIRDVSIDGEECREVFALKDGLPIKQICSEN